MFSRVDRTRAQVRQRVIHTHTYIYIYVCIRCIKGRRVVRVFVRKTRKLPNHSDLFGRRVRVVFSEGGPKEEGNRDGSVFTRNRDFIVVVIVVSPYRAETRPNKVCTVQTCAAGQVQKYGRPFILLQPLVDRLRVYATVIRLLGFVVLRVIC